MAIKHIRRIICDLCQNEVDIDMDGSFDNSDAGVMTIRLETALNFHEDKHICCACSNQLRTLFTAPEKDHPVEN